MGGKRWDVGSEIYDEISTVDESAILFYLDIYIIGMWHWPVLRIIHVDHEMHFFSRLVEGLVGCDFDVNGSGTVPVLVEIPVEGEYADYCCEGDCGRENDVEAFGLSLHFYPSLP